MLSSLASLLDSFRIPNRRRRGFNIFSRRRRRQTSSLRCQGIPGVSLQETLAHEPLEQRRLLAVDVSLAGSVLTVSFDDASADEVSVAITDSGYDSSGANISSGNGTITQLIVQDSGTAQTSSFTLTEASQNLTGGVSIASEVDASAITSKVNTDGGAVAINSSTLTLGANVTSGGGSQTYDAAVVLASDVNLTTSTGVGGDLQVNFQGTVDSDDNATPRTLNVHSEAIYFDADVGSQSPLNDFVGYTVNDNAERGQFYHSVHTTGNQTYQAGSSSGDVEFNGTYTAGGGIELLGEGTFGVVLSLAGDTNIDVGTGAFSVQKGSSNTYPGGNIVSQGKSESYDLTITAGNITVPAGVGVASAGSSLSSPELKDFTINGIGTVGLNTPEVITTGDFTANPAIKIYQDTTLLSGDGEINLSSGVNNGSKSLTLGDSAQTGSIFVGGLQVRHLEVGNGAFDVTLDGAMHLATNLSQPTKFLNTGSLTLIGQGSSFFGGVEALSVSQTNIAGCVSTFGGDINLNNVMMLDSTYAARFDTRWTQTQGGTAGGGDITISNFNTGNLNATKSVEFDIGNGTPNTVSLTGNIVSNNELRFKGIGAVNVSGEANLAGGVHAQNLSFETDTIPSLNFTGNVTLTGPMEFEGTSATFTNGVEGGDNDLTLNFSQTATVDGYSNVANFTSEGAVNLSGNFTTTGFQKYEGNVALGGDTELVATTVEFADGVTGNYHNLTLSPSDSFIKLDGIQLSGVENLTIGGDLNLSGSLSAGDIDIQGNTTLIGDADLTSELVSCLSSRQIILNGTVDGAHALTVNGTTDFRGEIGGTTPLASLTTEGGESSPYFCTTLGANVTTTGDQTFGTPVTITSDTTFSGGNLSLARIIGGGPTFDRNVEFDFADTTIRNAYGGPQFINIVDLKVTGTSTLSGEIYTTGNQSFQGQTSLDGDTTLLSNNGTILLTGGVGGGNSGSRALTLGDSAQTGNIFIGGLQVKHLEVGNGAFDVMLDGAMHLATNLAEPTKFLNTGSLTLVGQGSSFFGGIEALGVSQTKVAGCVATFGGDISLNNVMMLDSTSAARFDTRWTQTHGGTAGGGDITISSFHTGTLNPTKSVEFDIGNGTPNTVSLTGNIVSNNQLVFKGIGSVNVSGDANLAGGVSAQNLSFETDTTPSLDFTGNVTLTGPMEFEGTSATFANGVEGKSNGQNNDLTLNFSQTATVDGYSNIANFTSEGAVNLSGDFTTSGFQKYEGNVALGGNTKLVATTVEFADGVTGNYRNLTLSPSDSFIKLDGIQLSGVENLTIDGDLSLSGNLSAGDIDIQGNTTLIGDANLTAIGSVFVQDYTDPTKVGNLNTSGRTQGLTLSSDGQYAFVADDDQGLQIIDISSAASPTLVGNFVTSGNARTVTLSSDGQYAFVAANDSGLQILDVSNVASPTLAGNLATSGRAEGVTLSSDGQYAFVPDQSTLNIIDISDVASPSLVSNVSLPGGDAFSVTLSSDGQHAFVAHGSAGLTILDVSNVAAPTLAGSYDTPSLARNLTLSSDGQYAFIADLMSGVQIVDVSDVTSPTPVSNLATPGAAFGITLSSDGQHAFVGDNYKGLQILDVSNVASPTLVGSLATGENAFGVALSSDGHYAYVTDNGGSNSGLQVVSLGSSSPGTGGGPIGFAGTVDGGHALSVNGTTDFHGEIGGTTPLASLTTEGGDTSLGGNVKTTGNQNFGSDVTLTGDTKFVSGNLFDLSGLVGGGYNVEIDAVNAIIDAQKHSVSGIADLTVPGDVGLNGSIATTGNQLYSGDVGVLGNTTLTAGSGAISLGTGGEVIGLSHTLTLGDASQTGDVTLSGDVSLDGLEVGQEVGNGAFNLRVNTSQFTVTKLVDILSTGQLDITPVGNSQLNFENGLNATNPSSIYIAGAIASSQGPEGLSFGYAKVGYDSPSATLTVGGNENAVISFNTLEISGGKLNYDGPVDIGDLNITTLIGDAALDVGINGTGYFHVRGNASVTGNVSSGGNLSDGGSQFYDGNVTLTGTAGFAGKSADFQKGIAGNNNNLTLDFTEQSFVNSVNDVRNFTSSGEVVLDGSFFTYGFQNFAGGINLAANTTLHAATGFIKLDGIQGENYELTINALAPADLEADVTIEGDVSLNSLNATSGNYNVSLIGSPMKFQQVTLLNSGDVTLGQSDTTDLVVEDGIVVDKASATFVAGTIASDGAGITLHNISLNANTTIDTTNGGSNPTGAEILLKESITFNGHTLKTDGGTSDTDFRGDMTLQNGTLDVTKGSVNFGESGNLSNAANITIAEQMTINVPENGALNVFDGSQVDAGNFPINIKANTINFESTAGSFTSTNEITIVPATLGNNISVGTATGDGLDISQTTFNKMQSPNVVIGGAGYTGTITVENLNSTNSGQLTLIANGTGGAIDISGGLDLQGQDSSGISLYVKGSGATTDLSGPITTAGAAFFDDAVRLVGDTSIVTSGGDVTITGGTEGIYSESGSNYNLSINAGAGDVVVGNQTGFGNGTTESLIGKVTLDSTSRITLGEGDQEMHSLDVFNSPLELGGSLGTSLILSGGFGGADLRTGITGNKSFLEIDLESGFVDSVKLGSITNVNNLAITEDSLSPSPFRKVEMHGDVTTIEGQSYEPNVELRNAVLLNAAGNVSIDGTLTAKDGLFTTRNVGITALGGKVSIADFGNGTTAGNHYDVAILAADDVDLGGGVGSFGKFQHGLQFLTINTITNSVNFNATSGLSLGGNLSIESSPNVNISSGATLETKGDLTINSTDISLGASVTTDSGTLTLNGTASVTDSIVLDSGSGDLTVTGALLATTNGTHDVTINSGGTAKIGGAVGNATAASDLFFANLTTDAGGTTEFNGNIFAAEQVFNDDIVLNQGTSTNLTAGGVNATFNGNVDAESGDIVLDFTTTAIDGSKWSNLAELTVNADTGGTIGLNGTITSSGSQTYNGAVQLDGDTTLIGGFALNLPQGVSGNSKNLVLDFINQPTSLAGNFTGINDLTSKGDVLISGEIRTSGNQSYDAGVTLDGYTRLQGNSLSLNGVNGGGNDLDIIFNTTTAINSNWTNISDFLADSPVSLTGNFSTQRQSYQNAVTLLGDTVLRASGTDYRGVAFDGNATIDGRHDLSIHADSTGTASINLAKAVGSSAPLRSLNLASAAAVEALESLTIDGTGGSGPGLRFGFAVDNINMTAAGSSISNAAQDGILFAGGSANSTLANFTVTNSGGNGITMGITMAGGDYTNTTIRDVVVTTSGAAAVSMSDDGHGLYANNATGFTVTDSSMTLNKGSGVYVEGSVSEGVTVSNSTFGIDGEGLAAGNKGYGIGFAGGKNHVADNNTIGGNDLTGLLAVSPVTSETVSNITFSNNWIGLTRSEEPMPNGQAGIWVLGDVTNSEGYTQGFVDDVKIQGNRVENAIFNGIEIDNATNVTVGGIGSEPLKHNTIKNGGQYGLALTGDHTGTEVHGNKLYGNLNSGLYLRNVTGAKIGRGIDAVGSLDITGSKFGVTAMGDLTGTQLSGNKIHDNAHAGVFMMGATNFDLFRNTIEDNGDYGVLAFEESTGTRLSGNNITKSPAGIWLSGASGLTIGYDETGTPALQRVANKIFDNYSVGIIIQGSTSADNRILSNDIYLNTYYAIQFVDGAVSTAQPPRLFAAAINGDDVRITGRLNGQVNDKYTIQYFQNKPEDIEPGRAPEGQKLVHTVTVEVPSEGFVNLDTTFLKEILLEYEISAGDWITATATIWKNDAPDQTSVFSSGVRVREVPDV